jgi:hypothetical protein
MQPGGFISKAQRDKVSMSIKQTHFKLGDCQMDYSSTAKTNYAPYENKDLQTLTASPHGQDAHFTLGQDKASMKTQSESASRYRHISAGGDSNAAKEAILKDLRGHHFQFGSEAAKYETTMKESFVDKRKSATPQRIDGSLRRHHFDLGNAKPTYQSTSRYEFVPRKVEDKPNTDHMDYYKQTHIKVGCENAEYTTTSRMEFTSKSNTIDKNPDMPQKAVSIYLGADKAAMLSTTKETYVNLKHERNLEYVSQQAKNVRSSHFILGREEDQFTSVSRVNYDQKAIDHNVLPEERRKYLKGVHFRLGGDPTAWQTCYNSSHNDTSASIMNESKNLADNKSVNFSLGSSKPEYSTTVSQDFRSFESVKPEDLRCKIPDEAKKVNFNLGTLRNKYASSYRDYGKPATEAPPQPFTDGKQTHVTIGSQKAEYKSTFQQDFQGKPAEKLNTDYRNEVSLRLGNAKSSWNTSYKQNFTGVKPVPTDAYSFSV